MALLVAALEAMLEEVAEDTSDGMLPDVLDDMLLSVLTVMLEDVSDETMMIMVEEDGIDPESVAEGADMVTTLALVMTVLIVSTEVEEI